MKVFMKKEKSEDASTKGQRIKDASMNYYFYFHEVNNKDWTS